MATDEITITLRRYFEEACGVLKVDSIDISFAYDNIGERFRTTNNSCEIDGKTLFINKDWIKECMKINDLYDLQYQMYHEARHLYQKMVIDDFHSRGKSSELPVTIQRWEHEFSNYQRNEGTEETQKANAAQKVEIDANAFAIALLYSKGIFEARAPKEHRKETEQRAQEIYEYLIKTGKVKV